MIVYVALLWVLHNQSLQLDEIENYLIHLAIAHDKSLLFQFLRIGVEMEINNERAKVKILSLSSIFGAKVVELARISLLARVNWYSSMYSKAFNILTYFARVFVFLAWSYFSLWRQDSSLVAFQKVYMMLDSCNPKFVCFLRSTNITTSIYTSHGQLISTIKKIVLCYWKICKSTTMINLHIFSSNTGWLSRSCMLLVHFHPTTQVVAWPCCKYMLERRWTCCRNSPRIRFWTHSTSTCNTPEFLSFPKPWKKIWCICIMGCHQLWDIKNYPSWTRC